MSKNKEIIEIKTGDIVEINGETFWICNCKSAPLNSMIRKVCHCCRCSRPTPLIPDASQMIESINETVGNLVEAGAIQRR